MDDDYLGAALHRATDDVEVPRDLVRQARHLGRERRERRARRRSGVVALGAAAVVLAGGALVVTSQQGGGSATRDSAAGAASSAEGGAGLDEGPDERAGGTASAESGSQPSAAAPEPMQDAAPPGGQESATCAPTLVIGGVPRGAGSAATPVSAGEVIDVASDPRSCEDEVPGARYDVVLAPPGSGEPIVLAGVTVADDGSFATRFTVPASTPPGPAELSVTASAAAQVCPSGAPCRVPDHRAALDVRPAEESP